METNWGPCDLHTQVLVLVPGFGYNQCRDVTRGHAVTFLAYYLVVVARKVPLLCNDPCWVPFYFLLQNGFLLTRVFCSHSLPRVSTPFQFSTNAEPFCLQDFLHFSGLCYPWISALIRPSPVQQRTVGLAVEISCALSIYNNVQIIWGFVLKSK